MAKEVNLPKMGQTMEEGTVVNCLVKVGDEVKKGDVIFEIETDKATLELESPGNGFVKAILAEVNQTLPVGATLMILGEKDEQVTVPTAASPAPAASASAPTAQSAPATPAPAAEPQPAKPTGKIMVSPRAKKMAEDLGVDLATIKGTGPAGKITEADIKAAAEAKPAKAAPAAKPAAAAPVAEAKLGATVQVNRLQRITAERMLKSKQEIPCFYLTICVDMTDLVAARAKMNETGGVKVAFNDFIMKAVATGLQKYPIMTGQLVGNAIKLADAIHIGLAISVPDGLVAPLVKDVNKKDVRQIARDSQALIERARADVRSRRRLHHGDQPGRLRNRVIYPDRRPRPVQHSGRRQDHRYLRPGQRQHPGPQADEHDALGRPQGRQRRLRGPVPRPREKDAGKHKGIYYLVLTIYYLTISADGMADVGEACEDRTDSKS